MCRATHSAFIMMVFCFIQWTFKLFLYYLSALTLLLLPLVANTYFFHSGSWPYPQSDKWKHEFSCSHVVNIWSYSSTCDDTRSSLLPQKIFWSAKSCLNMCVQSSDKSFLLTLKNYICVWMPKIIYCCVISLNFTILQWIWLISYNLLPWIFFSKMLYVISTFYRYITLYIYFVRNKKWSDLYKKHIIFLFSPTTTI